MDEAGRRMSNQTTALNFLAEEFLFLSEALFSKYGPKFIM